MCLVAEYTTRSAPSASGCWSIGVANTLSTITRAPARCASAQTASMSTRSRVGLPGVSKNTSVVGRASASAQAVEVAAVDQDHLDAEARQQLAHDVVAGAEQQARRDDPVAGLEQRHQRGMDRGHAGGGRGGILGTLEQRQALLEHAHGRVGDPRVLVARLPLGKALGRVLGALVAKARGQEQGLGGLTEL